MWRTQNGIRTLKGAEAELIRESLGFMCDMLREEYLKCAEQWEYDVRIFDKLNCKQRIVLLSEVAKYLLAEIDDYPPLNAINEGTVVAIYKNIKENIIVELDESLANDDLEVTEITCWRSLILAACKEAKIENLPDINDLDFIEWEINLEILEEQVLGGRNFETSNSYLNLAPETGKHIKNHMQIDDGFTAIFVDPTDEEVEFALMNLLALTR